MQKRFYIDTSIWLDLLEDRSDGLRPLGELAFQFLKKCVENGCAVFYSRAVVLELKNSSEKSIDEICDSFHLNLVEVKISLDQTLESKNVAMEMGLPSFDVLHAILARDNNAVLVSRDRHFEELQDIVESAPPERITFG